MSYIDEWECFLGNVLYKNTFRFQIWSYGCKVFDKNHIDRPTTIEATGYKEWTGVGFKAQKELVNNK